MTGISTRIIGTSDKGGELIEAQVRTHHGREHAGLVVLTDRLALFNPEKHSFLNDTFGNAMNQNVAFGGTPEIIHNGGTSVEWTGSAIQGPWNFADAGKISLTSADNNDEATFAEETPAIIDMSGFTTLTGKINLTTYSAISNSLLVTIDLAGTTVGNSVNLNNYIDTGLIGIEQSFVIPKADLGITTQLIDGFSILLVRTGGSKPTIIFDDIQFEETGEAAVFKATTPAGTELHIHEIRVVIADNITGITTVVGATENATVPNLSYDKLLGLSALANGISFQRIQKGRILSSVTFKQLGDFMEEGYCIVNHISDGTNTFIALSLTFVEPIVLAGNGAENLLSFTINDDLSGLLQFSAIMRGSLEI